MMVLLKDKMYIADTIDILAQLTEDADLNGDPQVFKTIIRSVTQ